MQPEMLKLQDEQSYQAKAVDLLALNNLGPNRRMSMGLTDAEQNLVNSEIQEIRR